MQETLQKHRIHTIESKLTKQENIKKIIKKHKLSN
jgi:hypothetical protein